MLTARRCSVRAQRVAGQLPVMCSPAMQHARHWLGPQCRHLAALMAAGSWLLADDCWLMAAGSHGCHLLLQPGQDKLDAIDDERTAHAGIFAHQPGERGELQCFLLACWSAWSCGTCCGRVCAVLELSPAQLLRVTAGRFRRWFCAVHGVGPYQRHKLNPSHAQHVAGPPYAFHCYVCSPNLY